jgi:FAD/FMN-containing dehydrogenase
MIKSFLILNILISLVLSQNNSYWPYTLPGYSSWPSYSVFQSLRSNISGSVIIKGDSNYSPHTWNTITNTPKPAVIVQPKNSNDIIVALKFAQEYNIRVSLQSTGHHQDHRNIQDNSILIDMSLMNSLSYDSAKKTLTSGPGNTFATIQTFVASQTNKQYVALGGADPSVGIYGWTVGGGHGALTRLYGLGVDALLSVDLVIANFTVITASSTQNQGLFRALRGSGGGAYGIAISLTVQLFPDPGTVSTFYGSYPLTTTISTMFANWMASAPNYASAYFIPNNYGTFGSSIVISAQCFSSSSTCSSILSALQTGCTSSCSMSLNKYSSYYDFIIV